MREQVQTDLGLDVPIFGFSHCRDVVAAVTRAGGVGILGAAQLSPSELDEQLNLLERETGGRPIGVDLLLPSSKPASVAASPADRDFDEVREFTNSLLDRYGVTAGDGNAYTAYADEQQSTADVDAWVDVVLSHKSVGYVVSALGVPSPRLVEKAHAAGVLVGALAGKVAHALKHRAAGVDFVVAQGWEAGGHTGDISTMVLIPDIVDAVAPMPVVAAGGIGRGRQIAAAMSLGAVAVWCGSVWLATREAETDEVIKEKLIEAGSDETVKSRSITGKPVRMLRTAWTDEWDAPEAPDPLPFPLQGEAVWSAYGRIEHVAPTNAGARELRTMPVGQIVGSMTCVQTVQAVIYEMLAEYTETVARTAAGLGE